MRKTTLLSNLRWNLKWLLKQRGTGANSDYANRAENIRNACIRLCHEAGQPLEAWSRRLPGRRKALVDARLSYRHRRHGKVLTDLVILTISALEAASWIDSMGCGALPLQRG